MQHFRSIVALLLVVSACSKTIVEQTQPESGEGYVTLTLSTNLQNEEIGTKAEADGPDVNDFRVAIYKTATQMRLYNDSYLNTVGKKIPLNAGNYRLVAQFGDTLGCGFDKPYYLADPTFDIVEGGCVVNAEAKLANVKFAVRFDQTITAAYADYYAVIKHNIHNKSVKFTKDESRHGYIPGGEVVLEVYAKEFGSQEWKYYKTEPQSYSPNDFVTLTFATNPQYGGLCVNILIDETVEEIGMTEEIPSSVVPQDAPSVTFSGFGASGNAHEFVEGQSPLLCSARANFLARGGVMTCNLDVESDWLAAKGVPASIDFTSVDAELAQILEAAGFDWDENMRSSNTFSYIDFSQIVRNMLGETKAQSSDVTLASFTITIVDEVGKRVEETFKIVSKGVTVSLDIKDYNVWARRVVDPVVTVVNGLPEKVKLQYLTGNGTTWSDIEVTPSVSGYVLNYGTLAVNSATIYKVRAIYNGNPACMSPVVTITTESELQIGNSGFEEYQLCKAEAKPIAGSAYQRNWYQPYTSGASDSWWACNSKQSMPSSHTAGTNWAKNFPSSGYVTDARTGTKSAMLFCVNIGNWNTDNTKLGTTYEGEIWIGTANDDGSVLTQGHAFASRPSKLTFYYKYTDNNSKTFFVDAWIKDASGNVIATAQEKSGPYSGEWKQHVLPFTYTSLDKKADTIFVRISASYGDGEVSTKKSFKLGEETVTAHAGCFLTIDDMALIYE